MPHPTTPNPFPPTPPTPAETQRVARDSEVLQEAADAAAFRPEIPHHLRRPLSAWLDSAARDALEIGSDPRAVALAQALLESPRHPVTDAGLELLTHDQLRDLVRQLTADRDGARAWIRHAEELHPSVHLVGADGAHWPDCPACRVALALGADVDPPDSWRLDPPGARVTACQVDETVNYPNPIGPKEH